MVGITKSWACRESNCLMAILLTSSTEWESYLPYGLRVAKFRGKLHVTQVRVLNQSYDFFACVCQGVVNVHMRVYFPLYFFLTESLTEPGSH